ncbi:MAG TPA: hypothetical protein VH684_04190 [Xanthobacteraceae bacterium]
MPPFVIPPLVKIALAALGVAAVAHWVAREIRRINAEIDRRRAASAVDRPARQTFPTLRRDPRTGVWRIS